MLSMMDGGEPKPAIPVDMWHCHIQVWRHGAAIHP